MQPKFCGTSLARHPAAPHTGRMPQSAASRFVPSKDGFTFSNDWPRGPAITVPAPMRPIGIGNAAAGLCGGMVFAALDYWHAGLAPPRARPASGSPLYRFIVRRLLWQPPFAR